MRKQLVRQVTFGKAIARVMVSKFSRDIDLDGDIVGQKIETVTKIEISVNDKIISSGFHASLLQYNNLTDTFYTKAKLDPNQVYTRVGDKAITAGREAYDAIKEAIAQMDAELAAEFGVKSEAQKERDKQLSEAQAVIEAAECEGVDKLMTEADIKVWRKCYNDLHNEGGEGYIPKKVSKERYEWALGVLGK
ncbi:hypothetical protein [Paenibacillus periandrae]|uniref:hypothetical protein n=1 Tax=Paenibacillus periandrae TaxID=1761741 RepID=UPI001F09FB55|nr:hypothetical protein [Paenibacillus periandrae]